MNPSIGCISAGLGIRAHTLLRSLFASTAYCMSRYAPCKGVIRLMHSLLHHVDYVPALCDLLDIHANNHPQNRNERNHHSRLHPHPSSPLPYHLQTPRRRRIPSLTQQAQEFLILQDGRLERLARNQVDHLQQSIWQAAECTCQ